MKSLRLLALAVIAVVSLTGVATATVVTFDDLGPDPAPLQNGYAGFQWQNVWAFDPLTLGYSTGYSSGTVSPENVAFNAQADPASVSRGLNFDFIGAFFTSAWYDDSLVIRGYDDGTLLYTTTAALTTNGPQWVAADFSGIDTVTFSTTDSNFAMDDFAFNEAAPVPEPGTFLLLGAGLAGLWLRIRKCSA